VLKLGLVPNFIKNRAFFKIQRGFSRVQSLKCQPRTRTRHYFWKLLENDPWKTGKIRKSPRKLLEFYFIRIIFTISYFPSCRLNYSNYIARVYKQLIIIKELLEL